MIKGNIINSSSNCIFSQKKNPRKTMKIWRKKTFLKCSYEYNVKVVFLKLFLKPKGKVGKKKFTEYLKLFVAPYNCCLGCNFFNKKKGKKNWNRKKSIFDSYGKRQSSSAFTIFVALKKKNIYVYIYKLLHCVYILTDNKLKNKFYIVYTYTSIHT